MGEARRGPGRADIWAPAGYLAAALLFFAGALPAMGSALPGGPVAAVDGWQNVWHLWWAHRALAAGENPLFTPLLYHPAGVNLAIHPLNLSNGLLFFPVTALAGPLVAYNVALLAAFALAGWGAFLLARRAGAPPPAAFVAGLLFTFSPFHATKAFDGQLEMVAIQWLPLYLWLLLGAAERPGLARPLGAGLLLALVGYTSLYYLLYAALLSLLVAALWLPRRPPLALGPSFSAYLGRLALVPLVAAALLAPLLLALGPALADVSGAAADGPSALSEETRLRSANLIDFLVPSYLHPLWGPAVARLGPWLHPGISAWNVAPGYVALGLAAVASLRAWGRSWRWLIIAGVGLLLALGPTLQVAGWDSGLPMPYQLLLGVPGMGVSQRPGHFVVLALLALVPLTALGLAALARSAPRLAPALALALAGAELAPPAWGLHRAEVHPAFAALAVRPAALLVLPPTIDSSEPLAEQIVHGRPLVGGFLARTPPFPFADHAPGVRQLWRLAPDGATLADPAGGTQADALAAHGIGDVVVRWGRIPPERRPAAEAALAAALPGVAPSYADGELSVYPVPRSPGRPLAYFGAGWYPQEQAGERRWRWMGSLGELVLVNPGAAAPVELRLRAEAFGEARPVELRLGSTPLRRWEVSPQPVASELRLRLLLPAGVSRLTLAAPAASDPSGRGPISIVIGAVEIQGGR